jgi:hypothetical protein
MSLYGLVNVKVAAGIFLKALALNLADLQNCMQITSIF